MKQGIQGFNLYLPAMHPVFGINDFRNTYVAHQEKELTDAGLAEKELRSWINGLKTLSSSH
ncbi:MAG: hypothetical protein FJ121_10240 [Deltaproteobacteria bacterium]|nr:hypothetical protein [Deltaproteobacteria bacterium]